MMHRRRFNPPAEMPLACSASLDAAQRDAYLGLAADKGLLRVQVDFGECLLTGQGVATSYGEMLLTGAGVGRDGAMAVQYLVLASEHGSASSSLTSSEHFNSAGDLFRTEVYLERAAEGGSPQAHLRLGEALREDDPERAAQQSRVRRTKAWQPRNARSGFVSTADSASRGIPLRRCGGSARS
jgi:TPR repeat protein